MTDKGPSQRQLRVGEELRHMISDALRRADFRDPALYDVNITVTEVTVAADLKKLYSVCCATGWWLPTRNDKGTEQSICICPQYSCP